MECTAVPVINQYSDPSECVWRQESNVEIKGMDKFLKRAAEGREQNETRKAAKDHRFGIVKQKKNGKKVVQR